MNPTLLRVLLFVVALFLIAPTMRAADAPPGFRTMGIQLYLPNEAMQERVPDVSDLGNFIKAMQKVCTEHYTATRTAEALAIVAAVKPSKQTRFWFISSRNTPDKDFDALRAKLAVIPPPKVVAGPVAFVLQSSIAGGAPEKPSQAPPIPQEWMDAAKAAKSEGPLMVPDGFLKLVWPD
jgi:hypothetical protein